MITQKIVIKSALLIKKTK